MVTQLSISAQRAKWIALFLSSWGNGVGLSVSRLVLQIRVALLCFPSFDVLRQAGNSDVHFIGRQEVTDLSQRAIPFP